MNNPSPLERKNLETHVELCAERYKFLEGKLESVEDKVTGLESVVSDVHLMIQKMANKQNDQLIKWAGASIAILLGVIGWLLATFVLI